MHNSIPVIMKTICRRIVTMAGTSAIAILHLVLAPATVSATLVVRLDNKSFRRAIEMWIEDPESAAIVYGDIKEWDVSSVSDMSYVFHNATNFNEDLSRWNVDKVKNVSHMFCGASSFDCNLSLWNTKYILDYSYMFANASSFNGDVSTWTVTSAYEFSHMFENAVSFDGDVSKWLIEDKGKDESSSSSLQDQYSFTMKWAQNMNSMFRGATSFHGRGGLSNWETYAVLDMGSMFQDCVNFDNNSSNNLSSWVVNLVRNFENMFDGSSFHDYLCWDIHPNSKTTNMFANTPPPGGSLNDEDFCGSKDTSYHQNDGNNYYDVKPFGDQYEDFEQAPSHVSSAPISLRNLRAGRKAPPLAKFSTLFILHSQLICWVLMKIVKFLKKEEDPSQYYTFDDEVDDE